MAWEGTQDRVRKDGSRYRRTAKLKPACDAQGVYRFTIAHYLDLGNEEAIAQPRLGEQVSTLAPQRFRALMDACQDAILISDWKSSRFVDVNLAAKRLFGYTDLEFMSLCGRDLIDESHANAVDQLSKEVHDTGVAKSSTLLHRKKDGTGLWGELTLARFGTHFEDGIVAILRDVTDRVQRERTLTQTLQDLRERNILFQVAFQDSPVGLAMSGQDGMLSSVNPAFCEMLGYQDVELLGRSVRTLTHPGDVLAESQYAGQLIAGNIAHYSMEKRFLHKNGTPVYVAMTIARADVAKETIYVAQLIDVSEARRAREQLARASHLAALGRMAAAVAHDVNNPAAYLQLNISEIQRQVMANELEREDREDMLLMLEDCSNGLTRISDIVRELQVFGTDIDTSPQPTNIAEVIRISCRLAAHEVKHHAQLILDLDEVPLLIGQPSKLGRVITNLVLNAARAVGTQDPTQNSITVGCTHQNGKIVVTVTDTGPGLPADRDDLFEPFVRGNASRGQGLGLWICAEIIRQHGGNISARNVKNGGAKFTFKLPPGNSVQQNTPAGLTHTHHLRVLVVDDEPNMLDAIYRSIRRHHTVTIEPNATEALARIRSGETFDIIVCDLMMPVMSGWEFQEDLSGEDPKLAKRIVFISGGAIGTEASRFIESSPCTLVTKPFLADDLLLAIEKARLTVNESSQ
jgi:PAS domain S-box-containing protein